MIVSLEKNKDSIIYYITYYQKRKERSNYIYQNNFFNPPTKQDFIVSFPSFYNK